MQRFELTRRPSAECFVSEFFWSTPRCGCGPKCRLEITPPPPPYHTRRGRPLPQHRTKNQGDGGKREREGLGLEERALQVQWAIGARPTPGGSRFSSLDDPLDGVVGLVNLPRIPFYLDQENRVFINNAFISLNVFISRLRDILDSVTSSAPARAESRQIHHIICFL